MELNFSQVSPVGGLITFPDVPNPAQPKAPEQILETVYIQGSSIPIVSMAGSVDSPQ